MEDSGYTLLPIDAANALRAGRLIADHGDPFDRMLAAQALASDMPILSKIRNWTPSAFAAFGRPFSYRPTKG